MKNLVLFLVAFSCMYCQQKTEKQQVVKKQLKTDTLPKIIKTPEKKTDSSYVLLMEQLVNPKALLFDTTLRTSEEIILAKYGLDRFVCHCEEFKIRFIDSNRVDYSNFTNYFEIDNQLFNLNEIELIASEGITIGNAELYMGCKPQKFRVDKHTYYLTLAGFKGCNGSSCGHHFYFLYNQTLKKLTIFSNFRWGVFFGDINQDGLLDCINTIYEGNWIPPDSVRVDAYTQTQQGNFVRWKDNFSKPYFAKITFEGLIYPMNVKNAKIVESYWIAKP